MKVSVPFSISTVLNNGPEQTAHRVTFRVRLEPINKSPARRTRFLVADGNVDAERLATNACQPSGIPLQRLRVTLNRLPGWSSRRAGNPFGPDQEKTFSRVAERVSPERLYWETKWGGSGSHWPPSCSKTRCRSPKRGMRPASAILYTGWRSGQQRPWGMNRGAFWMAARGSGRAAAPAGAAPGGYRWWLPSAVGRPANTI